MEPAGDQSSAVVRAAAALTAEVVCHATYTLAMCQSACVPVFAYDISCLQEGSQGAAGCTALMMTYRVLSACIATYICLLLFSKWSGGFVFAISYMITCCTHEAGLTSYHFFCCMDHFCCCMVEKWCVFLPAMLSLVVGAGKSGTAVYRHS